MTNPDAIWVADDGSEAIVKLHLPGLELMNPSEQDALPIAVLLHFTMSTNGHHLLLNNETFALQIPNPSQPPLLYAQRVPVEYNIFPDLPIIPLASEPDIISLDYTLTSPNRDDPYVRYSNHHPHFYLDIVGAGIPTTLLHSSLQYSLSIELSNRQPRSSSNDDDRRYGIDRMSFENRSQDYALIAARPGQKWCGWWSWRCADLADPPWYSALWREEFDGDGRIGSGRRVLVMWKRRWTKMVPRWLRAVFVGIGLWWMGRGARIYWIRWRLRRSDFQVDGEGKGELEN